MPKILFFDIDAETIGLSTGDAVQLGSYILDMQTHIEILEAYIQYFIDELAYIETIAEE